MPYHLPGSDLRIPRLLALPGLLSLAACHAVVLDPAGDVASRQAQLLVDSTLLMLLIIVPVMALTALFAWRYRASGAQNRYAPNWDHSTRLELVIWSGPLLIIICLGALTWVGTHLLDPYRSLSGAGRKLPAAAIQAPLEVDVVALDWKWLFIYPEYGIASLNELAAPLDRPIRFRITASSVMNSFYIPALAGQIYAMPGMETTLHAVVNRPGRYQGFSANYSGAGFSGMHFAFLGLSADDFVKWTALARHAPALDRAAYLELETPSEDEPVRRFASVERGLYEAIVGRCVEAGKMCAAQMQAIDAQGGRGLAGIYDVSTVEYDKHQRRGAAAPLRTRHVVSLCTRLDGVGPVKAPAPALDESPLQGPRLPMPGERLLDGQALPVAAVSRAGTPY